MVNSLAPNTEPCSTPDVAGRLCERESPTQTWLFRCSMYDWNHLKEVLASHTDIVACSGVCYD